MGLKLGLVLGLALIGAILGWRGRRRRRSLYDETPFGMSDSEYRRQERRTLRRRKIGAALAFALVGAIIGWVIGTFVFRLH